ncbi:MAG: hypothetical protein LUE24_05390 [Lachnospiraceae bacterium]|nr:hypothetical protein [Lachnospiraceae bacterium]
MSLLCACGSSSTESATTETEEVEEDPVANIPAFQVMETASEFAGGDGSEENPYQIATPQQLMLFAEHCVEWENRGSCYVLTGDIIFNDVENIEEVEDLTTLYGWESTGYYFSGTFDGDGHSINGLYIYPDTGSDMAWCGFIGDANDARISNLSIVNSCVDTAGVSSVSEMGVIVGNGYNTEIQNCSSDATIRCSGVAYSGAIGGIVGWMQSGGILQDCSFSGTIELENCSTAWVGGIAGYVSSIDVLSCNSDFRVFEQDSAADIGGIIGEYKPGADSVISDCVNYSDLTVSTSSIGGLIHTVSLDQEMELEDGEWVYSAQTLHITGCSNEGELYTETGIISDSPSGGLIATIFNSQSRETGTGSIVLEDCTNYGSVAGVQCVGGLVGQVCNAYTQLSIKGCVNHARLQARLMWAESWARWIFAVRRTVYRTV